MRKINESYIHEGTGIEFNVNYEEKEELFKTGLYSGENRKVIKKKVQIIPNRNGFKIEKGFVFNRSKPETIIKIGKALQEIGEFTEKL